MTDADPGLETEAAGGDDWAAAMAEQAATEAAASEPADAQQAPLETLHDQSRPGREEPANLEAVLDIPACAATSGTSE